MDNNNFIYWIGRKWSDKFAGGVKQHSLKPDVMLYLKMITDLFADVPVNILFLPNNQNPFYHSAANIIEMIRN